MQKQLSLILFFTIIISTIIPVFPSTASDTNQSGKIICQATLDDDFADDCVVVVINKDDSKINKLFSKNQFKGVSLTNVEDLTYVEGNPSDKKYLDQDNFKQVLKLDLKKTGKEEVLKAIRKLEKLDFVLAAMPNYYIAPAALDVSKYDIVNEAVLSNESAMVSEGISPSLSEESTVIDSNQTSESITLSTTETPWWFTKTSVSQAWEIIDENNANTSEILVGVIDSGVSDHDALNVRWDLAKDFYSKTDDDSIVTDDVTTDGHGNVIAHGTLVAGIIGANSVADSEYFGGVCPNVSIVPLQATTQEGKKWFETAAIERAIQYAINNNIPILNCSYGGKTDSAGMSEALRIMHNYKGLFVCAAGNESMNIDNNLFEPAGVDLENIITVANSTQSYNLYTDSNYGVENVDISAPGSAIYTTAPAWYNSSEYTVAYGTSMSAPFVSGVAALILSVKPGLPGTHLKHLITSYASYRPELDGKVSNGAFLNAAAAVQGALDDTVKITFNNNDGNASYVKHFIKGLQYDYLPSPERTNCTFNAWYDSSGKVTEDTIVTSGDKWFYANWGATVTYHTNGGTSIASKEISFGRSTPFTPSKSTVRDGCRLYGWRYGNTTYTGADALELSGNADLYAVWEASVTYGCGVGTPVATDTIRFENETLFTINKVSDGSATGAHFLYWFDKNGTEYGNGSTITITGDVELTAKWSATVTYSSSGSKVASDTVEFTDSGELVITKTSSWVYRKFIGWIRPDDTTVYSVGDKITGITGDTTLTAKWEDIYVVLTYDAKHLGWYKTQQILFKNITGISGKEKAISSEQLLTPATGPYRFVGWQIVGEDNTIYVPKSTASLPGFKNYQLIDVVESRVAGGLTYDVGEGQMENTSQILNPVLPNIITKEEPTRTGYTFLGWATTEDGDVVYAPGSEYEGQFNDTLYAKWISDDFVIRYDTGTDTTDEVQAYDPPLSAVYIAPGTNSDIGIVLSTVVPKRDGYTFLGWSYGGELYQGGKRFILPASVSSAPSSDGGNVIKLTAVWERYPSEVLISFFDPAPYTWLEDTYYTRCVTRGGTYGNAYMPSDETMTADFPTVPDLYGKYFIGWADADGDLIGEGSKVAEDDFHMLYSAWTADREFSDLEYGSSASRSASICAQFGIMQGVSDRVFSPGATVTRGTAATVLYRLEGSPVYGNNIFYDVVTKTLPDDEQDREQSMAVTWISENGFAGAFDANADACYFGVTENITRAQLVTVLYRYALQKGLADDSTVYPDSVLSGFTDADQLGQWAIKPMQWAVSTGLISGTTSTTLSPDGTVTRIALATVTARMIQRLISNGNFEHSFTPGNVNQAAEALGYVSETLDNNSWETISAVSAAGIADAVWNVGDEKTVTLSTGESVTVQIYGFGHDDLSDGSGKAGITFGLKEVMQNTRRMHNTAFDGMTFTDTDMYFWLNGELYSSLPAELRTLVASVDKKTAIGDGGTQISTNSMKIFLFSEVECFGNTAYSVEGEGSQYAIFAQDSTERSKVRGNILEWWERSPKSSGSSSFCIVHSSGNAGHTSSSWPYAGVNFGFCV